MELAKEPLKFPFIADSKEEILAWGEDTYGSCQVFECTNGGNDAIVLLIDTASGVYDDDIYIFGKSKGIKKWRFVLYRPTAVQVKMYQENDKLIFKTVTDDVILEQSLDALGPFQKKVQEKWQAEGQESDQHSSSSCQTGKERLNILDLRIAVQNKEALLAWEKQHHCRSFEYNDGKNCALVLLADTGSSGIRNDHIYIFGKCKGTEWWRFVIERPTDVEVKVYQGNGKLIFKTVTDDVIFEQPFDVITSLREIVHKKWSAEE